MKRMATAQQGGDSITGLAPRSVVRLDRCAEPRLARVLAYWQAKCGDRPMPARAEIDPVELGPLLPLIYLVDIIERPPDFRYRLLGTDIVANTRTDFTGRKLSDLMEEGIQPDLARIYAEVRDRGEPAINRIPYTTSGGNRRYFDNVTLPLGDGRRATMLLGAAVHYWREDDVG